MDARQVGWSSSGRTAANCDSGTGFASASGGFTPRLLDDEDSPIDVRVVEEPDGRLALTAARHQLGTIRGRVGGR